MPLPMPRSVIISPSHMITPVPAVIVMTRIVTVSAIGMPWVAGMIGVVVLVAGAAEERAGAGQRDERRRLQDARGRASGNGCTA